jgi:mannan endo-1,4-beta-mannosidase
MTRSHRRHAAWRIGRQRVTRMKIYIGLVTCAVALISTAVTLAVAMPWTSGLGNSTQSVRYLGVYEPDAPGSYAGIDQFAQAIGKQPNLVSYYSPWLEPFQLGFASSAASHGAIILVQIDATNVSLASITAGRYDDYLRSYATAVKAFGSQVILSFGHEMNGYWYSWGKQRTSPAVFVAAWRHIVTVFRGVGAGNVIWLWTVNVVDGTSLIPNPAPWWPGSSYVTWVGIDGYYNSPSSTFAQVFGPTIVDVRALTGDPILISETGAEPAVGQQAKIADLFAGIRTYGLLGFLWFDENYDGQDWRIDSPQVLAKFRQDAAAFFDPSTAPGQAQQRPSPGSSSP